MGGKGGGGAGYVSYDYYGTIAAVLRCGPIDQIESLVVDGEIIWFGPINRHDPGVGNPYTLTIQNPTWLAPGGYVRLYWGDSDQETPDAALPGHPPYRGFAYLVFHKFLFGRERTTVGNIEVVATAKAHPPGSIIAAPGIEYGCVNLWAVLADALTSIHGAALPAARLDAASWAAAHTYFAATAERKLMTYVAPILTDQIPLAQLCSQLLDLCDGGLRLKDDGTIEAYFYPVDPGDLSQYTTLTANDLEGAPQFKCGTWDSVPTGAQVNFVDQWNWFADWSVKVDDIRALQQSGEPHRERLELPFITRQSAALKLGAEWVKRKCQPQISGSISVRPERAINPDGTPLRVGCRFLLDVDPEPGGGALLQLCRVVSRAFKSTGAVKINWEGEVNQPVVPFTPDWTPPSVEEITVAALASARIVPMPFVLTGGAPAVAALAARGDDLTVGAHLLFDVAGGAGTFRSLGVQSGFAVPIRLAADYGPDDAGAIRLELTATRDQAMALQQPEASGAQNNELLVVLYKTASDYIDVDADGHPLLEWFSIESSAVVSGDTYDFTILRARLGSALGDWATDDVGWIIPRINLTEFRHVNFPAYVAAGSDLVFRMSPYSRFSEYDGVPADLPFRFPTAWQRAPLITWATPSGSSHTLAGTGNLTPAATVTDRDGNLVKLTLYSERDDTGIQTTHFSLAFARCSSKTLAQCFALANLSSTLNFAGQTTVDTYYTLTLRGEDSEGNVVESRRSLLRLATGAGGSGFVSPEITETGANGVYRYVDITTAAPATKIQYGIVAIGAAAPGSPTTVTATVVHLSLPVTLGRRVWARSGDAVNPWSAWVFEDFDADSGGL